MSRILGVDLNAEATNWPVLAQNGVKFAITKLSQGDYMTNAKAELNIAGAKANNMYIGGYHWLDPIISARRNADRVLKLIDRNNGPCRNIQFVACDFEQYWASWAEFNQHKIVHFLTPQGISDVGEEFCEIIAQEGWPVSIYTRFYFIQDYARPALNWIGKYPLWTAQWPYPKPAMPSMTWAAFQAKYPIPANPAKLPSSHTDWLIWQWTGDAVILPGKAGAIDLNVAEEEKLVAFMGSGPLPPVEPTLTLEQRVARLEAEALLYGWRIK